MNAEKATSLVPLYGGEALLVLAATGAALSLTDSEGRATGGGACQGGCTYVEACCASSRRNKKTPEGRLQALPKEIEARDRERIGRIIFAQVAQTPERIDETWLVDVCQCISGPPSLDEIMMEALEEGKKLDAQYRAAAKNLTVPTAPRYFINEAAKKLERLAQGAGHGALSGVPAPKGAGSPYGPTSGSPHLRESL